MKMTIAEQRACLRSWVHRRIGDAPITMIETHFSILALAPDRVWKLKKAVRLPFVDLSTADLRRRNAEREVALNRRYAPDVYLGVIPLEDDDGLVVDSVVEMRRMPDDRRLAARAGSPDAGVLIDGIAESLVRIHGAAPSSAEIDQAGTPAAVGELWTRNVEELHPFTTSIVDADLVTRVADDARGYLAGRGSLFARRIGEGRIRDGHGDLLADDVFCLDDGPRFLDCLEFDDQLRYGDVLADVAFLAMDLQRLGHRVLADRLLDAYRRLSGDSWPRSLADFYIAYRAVVRSKVACLRATSDDPAAGSAADGARQLLALAAQCLARARVRLVLVGGPPGTGKTTLARELERRTGWQVVRSDEVRKRLAGLEPTTSASSELDAGLYTPEWTARTYDALIATAQALLGGGESVILDASWSRVDWRRDAEHVARSTSSAPAGFQLVAPGGVADARIQKRASSRGDASDASTVVAGALRDRFDPWPGAIELDATQPVSLLATTVLEHLDYPD